MRANMRATPVTSRAPIAPIVCALVGWAATATHAEPLNVAVDVALRESPAVKAAVARARAAGDEVSVARARMLPNFMLEAAAGPAYRDRSQDATQNGDGDVLLSRRATASLSQLLFDWGASNRLVDSAKMRRVYQDLLVVNEREEQALLVAETYVGLIGARLKANLVGNKIGELRRFADLADKRKKGEGDTQSALLNARVGTTEGDFERAKGQVVALEERYRLLTTLSPSALSIPRMPGIVGDQVDAESSPRVLAARHAAGAQAEQVRALRRDILPTLALEARGGWAQDTIGVRGPDNEWSALAVCRWNPFDGGRKQAVLSQAKANLTAEQAVVDDLRQTIQDRIATAMAERHAASRRYAQLADSIGEMDVATKKFSALFAQEQEGATPLSVAAIFAERITAQMDAVDAWIDSYRMTYRALAAGGRLLDHFGVAGGLPAGVAPKAAAGKPVVEPASKATADTRR